MCDLYGVVVHCNNVVTPIQICLVHNFLLFIWPSFFTGKHSFDGESLHSVSPRRMNPYEHAMTVIANTLSDFDEDNKIPCFGFGDGMLDVSYGELMDDTFILFFEKKYFVWKVSKSWESINMTVSSLQEICKSSILIPPGFTCSNYTWPKGIQLLQQQPTLSWSWWSLEALQTIAALPYTLR